jgi:hypothetical protein
MKKTLIAVALTLGLASSSCLGTDNLYRGLKNWNAGLSGEDWVNELVFVGMVIIPIYPIVLLGDVLIFNTIEYWTGDNPITSPAEFPGFTKD